jgi:hypothetical protein
MLSTNSSSQLVAAPWALAGEGYILLYQFPPDFIASQGFIPADLLPHYRGGLSSVMLVNYQHSDAGPYQELLFLPGRFEHAGRSYYSISKIYVSTTTSVISGRRNWGIPKELANFEFETLAEDRRRVQVRKGETLIAAFDFQTFGPRLPVTTRLLPAHLRTLLQCYEDKIFFTAPGGRGALRFSRLMDSSVNPNLFPNIAQGRLLASVQAADFDLRFPEAQIQAEVQHTA